MDRKSDLPPYSAATAASPFRLSRRRPGFRRSRVIKAISVASLILIALGQWTLIWNRTTKEPLLSAAKLRADLQTCAKLRSKPQDPIGLGRDKNARYIEGSKPTLIKNAIIWVGEPIEGTSAEDARAGKGWEWIRGDVLLEYGLIQTVQHRISLSSLPDDAIVFDAEGRQLTAGVIDMHSHAGVYSLPQLQGSADGNEGSDNITPWARSIDAIMPLDPQIQVIKSGGVTTSLVLPGSANNIGGEAYVIKHAVGKKDGRNEISAADMLADPERSWRYMKMACGENPKRYHGSRTTRPMTRMGESFEFRKAFVEARALIQKQDDWCAKAEVIGVENMNEYLPQEIFWEPLVAALRGQVHINTHCYTIPDLEAMVDHTNEFEFPVRAFHHAHQTFLVPEILNRTWGGRTPASALFADNMYYKQEAYIGSQFAGKYLYDEGLTTVYVSDNPVLNAQHVLFEAAKGYHWGLPYHAALSAVTSAPAELLGLGQRLGKIKPGFDADVVVWDSDPLSVGATPVQVWIDGTAQYENPVVLSKNAPAPIVPDEALPHIVEEPEVVPDALFKGITKVLLSGENLGSEESSLNAVITNGKLSCLGTCELEFKVAADSGIKVTQLTNGYLYNGLTGVAGTLGLNEIDAESSTDNGDNPATFSRAIDGLALDSKKLDAAVTAGVTRAFSAPKFLGGATHHGTSVGFVTDARISLDDGAVFADDVAVHYTLDGNVKATASFSAAFGSKEDPAPYSEAGFLKQVLEGERTLALTINSADGIASALRVKKDLEAYEFGKKIRLAIIGGAESHIVAKELAKAHVGVILTPLQAKGEFWDSRRALPGAPLTNGTTIDRLLDAGVKVGIGLLEDWEVRDLAFAAGTAYRNGEGRLTEQEALDLVSTNIHEILGAKGVPEGRESGHFVVSEGSPLTIGSQIKAVGSGKEGIYLFV
uniref:Amidohydrolase 3 domain-containing protein n=1 Tax=Bionectria ochroleuca TaxID=29856 RepID=A0A8H7KBZ1_BIOOC